ncbi:hypothetical protein Tco_1081141 [Tanacetum coccineum]|uniref:Gag-Pol polyprotein n=1 Tax=Tanacetum coccineum TaxID=301880 RepID=A0ABQ5HWP9_9ASTR
MSDDLNRHVARNSSSMCSGLVQQETHVYFQRYDPVCGLLHGSGNEVTSPDLAILSGADNCPPMLEKDMYDSWKSKMELYMMNRQHGRMILESVENGPLIWPSIEEN